MTDWTEILGSPYLQFAWFAIIVLSSCIVVRISGGFVFILSFMLCGFWIMFSTAYGVFSSQPWMYLLHMGIATLLAFALIVLIGVIVDKWGTKDFDQMAMIAILGVPNLYLMTLLLCLPVKGGIALISWLLK